MMRRHRFRRSNYRSDPAARRQAESAAATSITASALLASLCVFYWYGLVRTAVIFPGPLQYLGLVAATVGILSAPSLVLLAGAQIVLNRGVSVRRHLRILVLAVALGMIACEALILANDASVTRSQAGISGWQYRWFPYSFRKVGYNESSRKYYVEF